ncbi:MAG: nucleoside deaminase, partial [Acidobacteriaceae bacterium]
MPYTARVLQPNPELMRRVIRLASDNVTTGSGGPFAALIVKDGRVIAEAVNTVFTTNDPTAHAEVNAIRKACAAIGDFALRGCEIYTSSEPCPMCLAAIYWAHLNAIYFGNACEDAAHAGFD